MEKQGNGGLLRRSMGRGQYRRSGKNNSKDFEKSIRKHVYLTKMVRVHMYSLNEAITLE